MHSLFSFTTAFFLAFSTLLPVASANEIDLDKPIIQQISTSTSVVAPGQSVKFSVLIEDASPITFASISIAPVEREAIDKTIYLKKNEQTGLYEGQYTVPTEAFNEKWKVTGVNAKDIHGNYTSLTDKGLFYDNWESTVTLQIFNGIDTVKPVISGVDATVVDTLSPFEPLHNVTAIDDIDGDLSHKITVSGKVNTSIEGRYTLTYSVRDAAGNETTATRQIDVQDLSAPVISFPDKTIVYADLPFDPLTDVTAVDAFVGDVSSSVQVTNSFNSNVFGNQDIHYVVSDKRGNKASAIRTVTVKPTPDFGLATIKDTAILVNSDFDPLTGVTLQENGQPVQGLKVTGTVNTKEIGVYELTYQVQTTTKQTVTKKRYVHVVKSMTPYFTGVEDSTIAYGTKFNPLQQVKAFDAKGLELHNVSASYGGDISVPGTHTITYTASDSDGRKITAERKVTIEAPTTSFVDVPQTHRAFLEIEAMKARGIINGYEDGTFKPSQNISRQHVAALIYRSGVSLNPVRPATTFKDVPPTHRYYNEIMTLYRAGIIDGSNGSFNPTGELTRAQLAKILVNAFDLKLQKDFVLSFSDVKSGWSKPYIDILSSNNITTGSNGRFMPSDSVSRLHYTLFMYRILK